MQIANGMVILSPENHQFKHDITPAEALILHTMHFVYANGNPLGDFFIQEGEAVTIDEPEKAGEDEWFNQGTGKTVPAKKFVPAKTHKRTIPEEIARLKKKYTGNITQSGVAKPAYEAALGSYGVKIPETFEEIEQITGKHFHLKLEDAIHGDDKQRTLELSVKSRPELVNIALGFGVTIHPDDSIGFIVASIVNAENKKQKEELSGKSKKQAA